MKVPGRRVIIGIVIAIVLGLLGWGIWRANRATIPRPEDREHARRTTVAQPEAPAARLPSGRWVAGNATIEPAGREVAVSPAEPGKLVALEVGIGDWVERGDVLAQLDHGPQEAAVEQARAQLAEARAQAVATKRGADPAEIRALAEEVEAARARAQRAQTTLSQTERLVNMGVAARDELDRDRRALEVEQAMAAAAESRYEEATRGRPEDVEAAESRLDAAQAALERAEADLERTRVRAPRRGEILDIEYRVGEFVPAGGTPLLWLGDTSNLNVRVEIDERDIGGIEVGSPAFVVADAYPERRFAGRVIEVGERLRHKDVYTENPADRVDVQVLEVVVALDDPGPLVPGLRVVGFVKRPPDEGSTLAGQAQ